MSIGRPTKHHYDFSPLLEGKEVKVPLYALYRDAGSRRSGCSCLKRQAQVFGKANGFTVSTRTTYLSGGFTLHIKRGGPSPKVAPKVRIKRNPADDEMELRDLCRDLTEEEKSRAELIRDLTLQRVEAAKKGKWRVADEIDLRIKQLRDYLVSPHVPNIPFELGISDSK